MAIEHAECFDIYGTDISLMLENGYAQVSTAAFTCDIRADPDGLSTQRVLYFFASSGITGSLIRYPLLTAETKLGVALRLWMDTLPTAAANCPRIIVWSDAVNTDLGYLQVDTTGRLSAYKGDGTLYGTTTNPVITSDGWWHIEAEFDATNGTMEVRVEGVTKLNLSGLSVASGTIYQTTHKSKGDPTGGHPGMYMKDMVWWNADGSENNDFVGTQRVINLTPTADVTLGDWTPSSGSTGYDILDNNPPSNVAYLEAGIADTTPMVFEMSDLPPDISSVAAVLTFVRAAKTDGGDGNLQVGVISDGTPGLGTDRPITAAQLYWKDIFEVDPDTAASWTPGAVDDAQIQIDRTA